MTLSPTAAEVARALADIRKTLADLVGSDSDRLATFDEIAADVDST